MEAPGRAAADHRSCLRRTEASAPAGGFTRPPTGPNPFASPGLPAPMDEWLRILLFVAAWFALQRWILPRLGVPT